MISEGAVNICVNDIVEELQNDPSTRFSKSDFLTLFYATLSDPDFKAKKYLLRNDQLVDTEVDFMTPFRRFLEKMLKHAGVLDKGEREQIIDTFEFNPRDVEWAIDAVDEAMSIYTECGKNMRIFRDKMLQLTIRKMVRSGKYDGKVTYKKTVVDRALALQKRMAKVRK